jgi:hypothetical protein
MEPLRREATRDTPKVILDKTNHVFEIIGRSLPENVEAFYQPIIEWIDDYTEQPNPKTELTIHMEYFNTASSKVLMDILLKLDKIYKEGYEVVVYWYYDKKYQAMAEAGHEFGELVEVPIKVTAR